MLAVSRQLSTWWCGTAADEPAGTLPFRPRSTSIQPIEGHWQGAGDILHRPDLAVPFPFAVECKNDERASLDPMFEAAKWVVWGWWEQTAQQAQRGSLVPLLIFRRNHRKDYAVVDRVTSTKLRLKARSGPLVEICRVEGVGLTLCLLEDLMQSSPVEVARLLLPKSGSKARTSSARSRKPVA